MTIHKLPRTAYVLRPGETFTPLTHGRSLAEFTVKSVVTGAVLGVFFGAANTYLGLKAGLTISTSIPVAVLTVVVFRLLSAMGRGYSILEANMSQTIGSASSSVASGAIFTLPALYMWGLTPAWQQLTLLALCGGLLGVLIMIPLRRILIREEHGTLPYPEGMACAEVLVAAEAGGRQASGVFAGIGIGMAFELLTSGLRIVPARLDWSLPWVRKAMISVSVSPALIGVGFILGIRVATVMVAGAALSWLVIIPAIDVWGRNLAEPVFPETVHRISEMTAAELWEKYIRYIGAGAVAAGGILTLVSSLPMMWQSVRLGIHELRHHHSGQPRDRTDHDLDLPIVGLMFVGTLAALIFVPGILGYLDSTAMRAVATLFVALFACFFVTVGSRIVGLVGQTSNPISGMTIASLLGTSLIFLAFGWTDIYGKATALMVGTVVCIAASISGDTSQDLKTGFILGATPRWQQIGELLGVLTSAGAVCGVLMLLVQTFPLGSDELPAPQATLMKLVIEGVLEQNLPWTLIGVGVVLAVGAALCRVPVLAFAVGVYLPLGTMTAIFVGGLVRWTVTRAVDEETADQRREQGTLFGSGLVGGGGLTGVVLALWVTWQGGRRIVGCAPMVASWPNWVRQTVSLAAILVIASLLVGWSRRSPRSSQREHLNL